MTQTQTFTVEGMSCSGCSGRLQTAISAVPGVQGAEVSHETGLAVVRHDGQAATSAAIARTIEDTGFDLVA